MEVLIVAGVIACVTTLFFYSQLAGTSHKKRLEGFQRASAQLGMELLEVDAALIPAHEAKTAQNTTAMHGEYEGLKASAVLRAKWHPPSVSAMFKGTYVEVEIACPHLDDPELTIKGEQVITFTSANQNNNSWQDVIFQASLRRGDLRLDAKCTELLPVVFPDIDRKLMELQFYHDNRLMRLNLEHNTLRALYLIQLEDVSMTRETVEELVRRTHRMTEGMRWTTPRRIIKPLRAMRARVDEDSPLRTQLVRALCKTTPEGDAVKYTSELLRAEAMNDLALAAQVAPDLFTEPARVKRLVRAAINALGDGDEQTSLSALKVLARLDAADALPALPALVEARDSSRFGLGAVASQAKKLVATLQGVADEARERGGLSLAGDQGTAGGLSLSDGEEGALTIADDS